MVRLQLYCNIHHLQLHTIKVYYPKHVEKSFHDYDETGKYMYAAKVDDTFWFFEERISGMPASFGGINT